MCRSSFCCQETSDLMYHGIWCQELSSRYFRSCNLQVGFWSCLSSTSHRWLIILRTMLSPAEPCPEHHTASAGFPYSHGAFQCHLFPNKPTHTIDHPHDVKHLINQPRLPSFIAAPWSSSDAHMPIVGKHGHSGLHTALYSKLQCTVCSDAFVSFLPLSQPVFVYMLLPSHLAITIYPWLKMFRSLHLPTFSSFNTSFKNNCSLAAKYCTVYSIGGSRASLFFMFLFFFSDCTWHFNENTLFNSFVSAINFSVLLLLPYFPFFSLSIVTISETACIFCKFHVQSEARANRVLLVKILPIIWDCIPTIIILWFVRTIQREPRAKWMAPIPISKACTSTMKGLDRSRCLRIGTEVNVSLSLWKASSAESFHARHLNLFFNKDMSKCVTELNPWMDLL